MRAEVVTTGGKSFAGCAAYCLHDEGRGTSERVAWTETVNLGTKNPDTAWRVMAATALDADRLKTQAGVSRAGRKMKGGPVLHLVLSWKPGEVAGLTREEMIRASKGALATIGKDTTHSKRAKNGYRHYGDECQALIVCHTDKEHPHVHIIANRVSPTHGRMLPSSNDHLKLSKWAQTYETRNGKIVTPQRVLNNEARARGEYVKAEPKLPRPTYEAMQSVSPAADAEKKKLLAEQTARARQIHAAERALRTRRRREWLDLESRRRRQAALVYDDHRRCRSDAELACRRQTAQRLSRLRRRLAPHYAALYEQRRSAEAEFEQKESQLLGRLGNALSAVDFKATLLGKSTSDDGRPGTLREFFSLLGSRGARLEAVRRQQDARKTRLERSQALLERKIQGRQRRRLASELDTHRRRLSAARSEVRSEFLRQREDLVRGFALEQAKINARWRQHNRDFREEWRSLAERHPSVERDKASELRNRLANDLKQEHPWTPRQDRGRDEGQER